MSESPMTLAMVLRKWLVFQLKLAADALRDLLLSPISTVLLLFDLLARRSEKDAYFEQLMALGRRSDHFINLFGNHAQGRTIDRVVDEAERSIRQRHDGRDADA